jgi:hypothetical protein
MMNAPGCGKSSHAGFGFSTVGRGRAALSTECGLEFIETELVAALSANGNNTIRIMLKYLVPRRF